MKKVRVPYIRYEVITVEVADDFDLDNPGEDFWETVDAKKYNKSLTDFEYLEGDETLEGGLSFVTGED